MWAGSTGTPPCIGTAIPAGTLTAANYTASYSYDALNRLTSAPTLGSYVYGTAPVHAATSTASGGSTVYSASYDAAGDMVCRAPSSATTCTGTPTGQQLQYDAERRVSHWQSAPGGSPTASADYLYDGSGNRVEQVDTSGGTSTKVYYLFGGVEEQAVSGSTSTFTTYYSAGGIQIGVNVGGTISYLASDGLGSVSEALSPSGAATAAQLYGPYGGVRYSSGIMPTAKGFTGQRADAISGLDDYGARSYDPLLGQFTSADTKQGPNRFAYVADDPETLTDPTGQLHTCMEPCGGGGGGGGSCHSDGSCGCYSSCGGGSGGGGGSGNGNSSGNGDPHKGKNPPPCHTRECYYNQKTAQLEEEAKWWNLASKGLFAFADIFRFILHVKDGAFFKAVLDFLSLASEVTDFLQAIGALVGRGFKQFADAAAIAIQKGIAIVNFVRGIIDMPFVGNIVQTAFAGIADIIMPVLMGPMYAGIDIVEASLGEATLDFMSAGGHWAQAQAESLADQAAEPIDEFCQQDGGCPKN